jgi:thiamine biosynthesis lipoprotein
MNHKIEFKAMGCRMIAIVDSPSKSAPELLHQVPAWFEEWEQCLSRFRPTSELNRLNSSAGWPTQVSETLWQVFQTALEAEETSGGLVTPVVLEALVAAGYDRSFDTLPRERDFAPAHPRGVGVSGWPSTSSLAEVSWDESNHSICLPADVQLDFGGVAKGWAADQAAKRLASLRRERSDERLGSALVSAGGDIAISAEQSNSDLWPVGVDDPFNAGTYLEILMLGRCGVATSGTDYRRWKQGGRWSHHIIDPRTGLPAQTDVFAATVIAPDAMKAEMSAKVALISGSQHGMEWLESKPELAGMLILESGERLYSKRMEQFLWRQS